jgi:hypothetical protein
MAAVSWLSSRRWADGRHSHTEVIMRPGGDPVEAIEELAQKGYEVPYLTFMSIFNKLLEDPMEVVPREPKPDLTQLFRATCMAISVGVADAEGRVEQRVKEFMDVVYPLWRDRLPEDEFAEYEAILRGRRKLDAEPGDQEEGDATPASEELGSGLLARLGIVKKPTGEVVAADLTPEQRAAIAGEAVESDAGDGELIVQEREAFGEGDQLVVGVDEPTEGLGLDMQEDDADQEELAALVDASVDQLLGLEGDVADEEAEADTVTVPLDDTKVRVEGEEPGEYADVDDLCEALRSGLVEPVFSARHASREEKTNLGRYLLDRYEVVVKLRESNTTCYTIVTVGLGSSAIRPAPEEFDAAVTSMGFVKRADFEYVRRDRGLVHTLKITPTSTTVARVTDKQGTADDVARRIQRLHRDLGEILEAFST